MPVELHGYEYSVYAWIARFALAEKGISYTWVEVNPFADPVPADYLAMHPFGRVPTLVSGDFVLFETGAITRYLDEAFVGPRLQPMVPEDRARVSQILSVVDSYAYWPLVRQVFAQGVIGPRLGRPTDQSAYSQGLAAAPRILNALDRLAGGGEFLVGDSLTLADIHLAPMIAYFIAAADGLALFQNHERLSAWWPAVSTRQAFIETTPDLPAAAG